MPAKKKAPPARSQRPEPPGSRIRLRSTVRVMILTVLLGVASVVTLSLYRPQWLAKLRALAGAPDDEPPASTVADAHLADANASEGSAPHPVDAGSAARDVDPKRVRTGVVADLASGEIVGAALDVDSTDVTFAARRGDDHLVFVGRREVAAHHGFARLEDLSWPLGGRPTYRLVSDDGGSSTVEVDLRGADAGAKGALHETSARVHARSAPGAKGMELVAGDRVVAHHKRIADLVVSGDGERAAYVAIDDAKEALHVLEVKRGVARPAGAWGERPVFSRTGGRLAYVLRAAPGTKPRTEKVVVDTSVGEVFDRVGPIAFSPDGKSFAYGAIRGARQALVVDGSVQAWLDYAEAADAGASRSPPPRPVFAEKGKVAFEVRGPKGSAVLAPPDAIEGPWFEDVAHAALSRDGSVIAYAATVAGKERLVVRRLGAVEIGPDEHDAIAAVAVEPDGPRVAAVSGRGPQRVHVAGLRGPPHTKVFPSSLRFDARRGATLSYAAVPEERRTEIDRITLDLGAGP
jgi:hypothetical protein